MNRLSKLRANANVIKSGAGWDAVFLKNLQLPEGDDVLRDPYTKSDLVYVCISTTAKAIAQVPLIVEKRIGPDWVTVDTNDPLQVLLRKPNTINRTMFDFINTVISHLLLYGHVGILPFPPGRGKFSALWVIPKENLSPVVSESTRQLQGWLYKPKRESKGIPLEVDELASIRFFNPKDPIMGMAPIEAGRLPVRTEYKTSVYNEKFFDEGAVPGGILSSENRINDSQFERIKKQFEDRHKGFSHGHRLAILDNGLKFTQTGLSQKDMMFPELKKMNRESILQIFGMKKVIISVTDDLNYATARTERREWWQGTNLPLMGMMETALSEVIFRNDETHRIVFDISNVEALHEDYKDKVITAEKLFKIGFTANEINNRLELGFDSKPWREFWFVPSNVVRVNEDGTLDTTGLNPQLPGGTDNNLLPEPEPEEPDDNPKMIAMKQGFTFEEEEAGSRRWRDIMGRCEIIQWEFESKVRRVFFDMRKKTLKLLNTKAVNDVELEEFLDDKRTLIGFTVPIYEQAMRLGVATLAEELGVALTFNLNDPMVIYYLTFAPLKLTGVIDTIKDQIRAELINGVTANETIEQIAGRLRSIFGTAGKRAMTISVTEVGRALNYARNMEIQKSPYEYKIWFTALDERVRMSHRAMHGLRIPVNQSWVLGSGATLRFPGDPQGPAGETINCRCIELIDTSSRII